MAWQGSLQMYIRAWLFLVLRMGDQSNQCGIVSQMFNYGSSVSAVVMAETCLLAFWNLLEIDMTAERDKSRIST